jgi:hypothetical protein
MGVITNRTHYTFRDLADIQPPRKSACYARKATELESKSEGWKTDDSAREREREREGAPLTLSINLWYFARESKKCLKGKFA